MKRFSVLVYYMDAEEYEVSAPDRNEAANIASAMAEDDGISPTGSCHVEEITDDR